VVDVDRFIDAYYSSNADIVHEYANDMRLNKKETTVYGDVQHLYYIRHLKFDVMTTNDILDAFRVAKNASESLNSFHNTVQSTRRFCKWIVKRGKNSSIDCDVLDSVKAPNSRSTKNAGDMLTRGEMSTLFDNCLSNRDRALLAILYEGGLRRGEICSPVRDDDYHLDSQG